MTVPCQFKHKRNIWHCRRFITGTYEGSDALHVTDREKVLYHERYPEDPWTAEAENKLMIMLVSDRLLFSDRIIFHSAAFSWKGRAWLLAAPSGTGKTTQYRNLKELYGDGIGIICGDNPILHLRDDLIMVHPSPWNGKENYGGGREAPLGGIILLSQSGENSIRRIPPEEAVIPVFLDLHSFARTPEHIRKLLKQEEKLITSVPVWLFENTGTLESTQLMMTYLEKYDKMEQKDGI